MRPKPTSPSEEIKGSLIRSTRRSLQADWIGECQRAQIAVNEPLGTIGTAIAAHLFIVLNWGFNVANRAKLLQPMPLPVSVYEIGIDTGDPRSSGQYTRSMKYHPSRQVIYEKILRLMRKEEVLQEFSKSVSKHYADTVNELAIRLATKLNGEVRPCEKVFKSIRTASRAGCFNATPTVEALADTLKECLPPPKDGVPVDVDMPRFLHYIRSIIKAITGQNYKGFELSGGGDEQSLESRFNRLYQLKKLCDSIKEPGITNNPYGIYLSEDETFIRDQTKRAESFVNEVCGILCPAGNLVDGLGCADLTTLFQSLQQRMELAAGLLKLMPHNVIQLVSKTQVGPKPHWSGAWKPPHVVMEEIFSSLTIAQAMTLATELLMEEAPSYS